ncbi:hypothetical protein O7606_10950 [Micromonospora sp. WMMD882]|uniref:hypothetical protein n=1 Tax=Micromonospora sp. WMMD882 TaxID=3015151 RepID=UPI00248BADB6|nr:hypothetical protein [Micromonospora sp. WMMD882]WBB81824.1 hypothetical protein O7606_10950 [Micromonospora sp. WMMD882]
MDVDTLEWPGTGWAWTTASCRDVNIRPGTGVNARVCFRKTGSCNSWKWAPAGSWKVIATDVIDGTAFHLQFDRHSTGRAAF